MALYHGLCQDAIPICTSTWEILFQTNSIILYLKRNAMPPINPINATGAPTAFRKMSSTSFASRKALAVWAVFLMWNTDENEHWIARFCSSPLTLLVDMMFDILDGAKIVEVVLVPWFLWLCFVVIVSRNVVNEGTCCCLLVLIFVPILK